MAKKKEIKTNAMRFLDDNNVEYTHFEFDATSDAAKTGVGVADIIGRNHNQVFKTIMTTDGKGNYVVGVLMSEDNINFKKLAKAAGLKSLSMLRIKKFIDAATKRFNKNHGLCKRWLLAICYEKTFSNICRR